MAALRAIRNYLGLIRVSHTLFALPFALAAMLIAAKGLPSCSTILLVLAAMVAARSCAMAVNRLADAEMDARNPRTALRHIPTGALSRRSVVVFAVGCGLVFVGITFLINPLAFALSPVVIAVFVVYPFTKRFTSLTHGVLGLALGLAPVGAWIAVTGAFALAPIVLGAAVLLWVAGFDVIYATLDEAFDREAGLHSLVVSLGRRKSLVVARLLHAATFVLLVLFGLVDPSLRRFYYIGLVLIAGLLVYEHVIIRRYPNDPRRINIAFFHINAVVSIVVLAFVALDLFLL